MSGDSTPDNQAEAGGATTDIDYRSVSWDEGEPPEEWHYSHRRAWILENELLEKGHPDLVNWSELARRFDKAKSTIHNDKEVLTDYLVQDLDEDRVDLIGQSIFEKGLRELVTPNEKEKMRPDGTVETFEEDPDWFEVAQFYRMWLDTLQKRGKVEKAPEEVEATVGGGLQEVAVEVAGVAPDDLDADDLDDMPEQDKPPELRDGGNDETENTQTGDTGEGQE